VLLVHRPLYGDWTFPKGKAEPGESDEECAVREVEEETGLRCTIGEELLATEYFDARGRPKRVRYWLMRVDSGEIRFDHEVDTARWLTPAAAEELLTYPRDLDVVRALERCLLEPAMEQKPETEVERLLRGRPPGQIGILVPDLRAALSRYSRLWPVGQWACYLYGPETVPKLTYRGGNGTYSMWIGLSSSSPQIELIEPVSGPSIYEEWLATHGEGLHHVGVYVEDLAEATRIMIGAGYATIQSGYGYGVDGDGGYTYFDTERELGTVLELIERPRRRAEPDFVFPG
jgi:8-oxo-dGTP pyrophosphatase MutT (NUDIX family)/catechol 2,3-dioxygenase-like lactoylglutathione lyase family enzyme